MSMLTWASVSVPLLASNSMVSLGALGVIVYVTQPPDGVSGEAGVMVAGVPKIWLSAMGVV